MILDINSLIEIFRIFFFLSFFFRFPLFHLKVHAPNAPFISFPPFIRRIFIWIGRIIARAWNVIEMKQRGYSVTVHRFRSILTLGRTWNALWNENSVNGNWFKLDSLLRLAFPANTTLLSSFFFLHTKLPITFILLVFSITINLFHGDVILDKRYSIIRIIEG